MRPDLAMDLPLDGRRVLVVGGGPAALGRIGQLREVGAQIVVHAAEPTDAVVDLIDRGVVEHRAGPPSADELARAWLVVAAAGDPAVDSATAATAAAAHRFCLPLPSDEAGAAVRPAHRVGRVVLVGGGPGDPGLITVAGLAAVRAADVLICDRLAPLAVLSQARPGAQVIDVSKIPGGRTTPQDEINRLLVEHATAGRTVVRLKGGDSFVFGRGGEEWQACAAAGIAVEIIPGVSAAVAAPALAGIPATHRTLNQGFTVVTGHLRPGDPRSTVDWAALARTGTALIIMMGVATLPAIAAALIAGGLPATTPAATVADAGLPGQRTVRSTVAGIAAAGAAAGISSPAVTVIGAVAAFDPTVPD